MPHPSFIPSIMQVLETGYSHQGWCEEGCSTVIIRADPRQRRPSKSNSQMHRVTPNRQSHLMKTVDFRNVENPEHFAYIVCFPDQDALDQDGSDSSTLFEDIRPKTSRGYPRAKAHRDQQPRPNLSRGQTVKFWSLAIAAQKLLPPKRTSSVLFKRAQH